MSSRNPGFWGMFWGTGTATLHAGYTLVKRADEAIDPIGLSAVVKAQSFLSETIEETAKDNIERRKRLDADAELKAECESIMAMLNA